MKQETLLSVGGEETGASEEEGGELTGETRGGGLSHNCSNTELAEVKYA